METAIRARIMALAEEKYRQFSASLIPNIDNVVGVRLPELRKLARSIAKGDWRTYLAQADSDYFEEVMLQGMVIGCAKADVEEILGHVAAFVPKIDNWSVCDSFCSGLKIASLHKERVWEFVQPYLESDMEYEIRFGVVMLLNYYADEPYIHRVLERLDRIKHEGYYVKMAVAWAVSICFVRLPDITMDYLRSNTLDDFTYNKALQKITESYRVAPETKALIRSMKRK
ncbi:DNA alkylation repair protein [Paenibacillus dendritiformis]|uniref:DNA alkylation repair protein n=1 Tax=Paenibacillus dendritiformis TaxID=130049 RepID=UPI00143DA3EC|nr:DNA alkylation repair protein [Paenibacillus dendritiformis]NKI20866.1 DNA alkylation repair protein [Paenibacillus dendritiformis]NRG01334.1 DNA alkylation repair protein [Paenibacillus dendritiformis]